MAFRNNQFVKEVSWSVNDATGNQNSPGEEQITKVLQSTTLFKIKTMIHKSPLSELLISWRVEKQAKQWGNQYQCRLIIKQAMAGFFVVCTESHSPQIMVPWRYERLGGKQEHLVLTKDYEWNCYHVTQDSHTFLAYSPSWSTLSCFSK